MCCMDLKLICREGMAIVRETDRQESGSVLSQLVMVYAGLHHLAAELVPHQHLLQFYPTKFLDCCFVKFLDYIQVKKKYFQNGLKRHSLVFDAFCHTQSSGGIQWTLFRWYSASVALHKEVQCVLHTAGSMLEVKLVEPRHPHGRKLLSDL